MEHRMKHIMISLPITHQGSRRGTSHRAVLCAFLLFVMFFAACSNDKNSQTSSSDSSASAVKERYTCPMHPSVVSDRPGACPVCNMALVKQAVQKEMSSSESAMLHTVSLSPSQRIMANVSTTPAMLRTMARQITSAGVLDVAEPAQATVTARFRGRIEKLLVNVTGSRVTKGQALLELYSPDLIAAQREYRIALEALTRAQSAGDPALEESQDMLLRSARDRLRVHYGLSIQQIAELEAAKSVRNTATFYAPISGTVLDKQVIEGQYVEEGTRLYSIADLSTLWAYLEIYETDLRFIRLGQHVTMTSAAWPGEEFPGRVSFVDPVMNPETRTVRVRVDVPNRNGRLKPQMYVNSSIAVLSADVIAVPTNAIIQTGKRNVVWVELKENQFEPRAVVLGSQADGYSEILAGLQEGDRVVTTGGYLIDSESKLQMPETGTVEQENGDRSMGNVDRRKGNEGSGTKERAAESGVKEVTITVDYAYLPDRIEVKKGQKLRLHFYRKEDSQCTSEVVFKNFGIRKKLPAFKTTTVEITPTKAGTFKFACGMDMVEGKLVVR